MYRLALSGVIRLADDQSILRGEPGWSDYLTWLAGGGVPDPISLDPAPEPTPDPVPVFISRLQAKAVLMLRGHLEDVEAILAVEHPLTRLAWTEAQTFCRTAPLIISVANQMGWSPEYVDDLFREAKAINMAVQ